MGIGKSSYFPKFFFERLPKIRVSGSIGLKNVVQNIEEFEKSGVRKIGYDCTAEEIAQILAYICNNVRGVFYNTGSISFLGPKMWLLPPSNSMN